MRRNNKFINFAIAYMITIGLLLIVSFLVWLLTYDLVVRNDYISNALFIPNMLIFIISIGINVGAGNIFSPLNYTFQKFFNPKKTKETYIDYAGYIEQKKKEVKNVWYLTAATVTLLLVAYLFTTF